ncbi:MAG: acetyl-CoA carboxylase carboxyltransferase subunit alpha [Zetaproteobacteria bacterium]|nr:MAG: acetyl-CoA carboxylase carboxyltransferase subunit alpha [Zetaproteobacteria bacterium]
MLATYLEFERPIAELSMRIEELSRAAEQGDVDLHEEIARLQEKLDALVEKTYAGASRAEICQLARHPDRPGFLDYLPLIFEDFQELKGDRAFADDGAIVGGPARIDGISVMLVGQCKGRTTREKLKRNFGMARPEGYRKALRLFHMAERFAMPVLTFIDTPGAWPGIDAEEHGQSEAIARNLMELAALRTPVVCTVIGEGGSGGALAVGVGDRLLMQRFSTYSVISPEGCAAILWHDRSYSAQAAEALRPTAADLRELGLNDAVVPEPPCGAHRAPKQAAALLRKALLDHLRPLLEMPLEQLLAQRARRLRQVGVFEGGG